MSSFEKAAAKVNAKKNQPSIWERPMPKLPPLDFSKMQKVSEKQAEEQRIDEILESW